ncbi:hypothetical protein PENTCL1PPCAC_14129, partial [Pristionchus entomophagus]
AATATKKVTKPNTEKKAAPSHPTYSAMIKEAIKADGGRHGTSRSVIANFIGANYVQLRLIGIQGSINARLRLSLLRGVKAGLFTQTKGTGANGSFGEICQVILIYSVQVAKPATKKAAATTGEKKPKSPKKKTPKSKTATAASKAKSPKKAKAVSKAKSPKKDRPEKAKSPKKAKAAPKPRSAKAVKA